MLNFWRIVLLALMVSLTACGGSGNSPGDDDDDPLTQEDDPNQNDNNQAPVVNAGEDTTTPLSETLTLAGQATDDGLPSGTLTILWQVAGDNAGDVVIHQPEQLESTVDFLAVGVYTLTLTVSDGDLQASDEMDITVTDQPLNPNEDGDQRITHNSGLVLEYNTSSVLDDSTDIDWMYRVWQGIAECQNASNVAYATIRLVESVGEPEPGDLLVDDLTMPYRFNLDTGLIVVPNADSAITAGPDQGVILANAMSDYMGLSVSDSFPDDIDCPNWHSGGRHEPSPTPDLLPQINAVHDLQTEVFGSKLQIRSDNAAVDDFTLEYVARLWRDVARCHGYSEASQIALGEVRILTDQSAQFSGDKWSDTGGWDLSDGGLIFIDADDMKDIQGNPEWGFELHEWMNQYLDAYADNIRANYECYDLNGIFKPPILPYF